MSLSIPAAFPASSLETVEKIKTVEEKIRERPQIEFATEHVFHAGMYARTVRIPKGVIFTNVLVKVPTLVIVHGDLMVVSDDMREMWGYNVCPAEAGRKQVYITMTDVEMTMIFPTKAQTVEQAEAEFTDETENLLSHANENDIVRTPCLESPQPPRS